MTRAARRVTEPFNFRETKTNVVSIVNQDGANPSDVTLWLKALPAYWMQPTRLLATTMSSYQTLPAPPLVM